MSATTATETDLLTIGAVCERLRPEFPEISISKIRYLEGEGLVHPKRTQGGYRLFSEDDVDRLETILRLQRDAFLPLRVIKQQLASAGLRRRERPRAAIGAEEELTLDELCEEAEIAPALARELEEFGLLAPRVQGGERLYVRADTEIAAVCGRLARFGIAPRHLRTFRNSADREAALLEQLVAPALRSRNPERRTQGADDLRQLAELAQELSQRLLWRHVLRLVS